MTLPIRFIWVGKADTQIMEDNRGHDDVSWLNSRQSVLLKKIRYCRFNIPFAFSMTAILKHFIKMSY